MMKRFWTEFAKDDRGTASLEFVFVFPLFFLFFLMAYESGMMNVNQVMLDRGVDIAVRDVRIGVVPNPSRQWFRQRICQVAAVINNCEENLEVEMLRRDPRNWSAVSAQVRCVDRSDPLFDNSNIENLDNNQLMVIRACLRTDPFLPMTRVGLFEVPSIGQNIVENNSGAAAGGSLALVSTTAFVVEPYMADGGS